MFRQPTHTWQRRKNRNKNLDRTENAAVRQTKLNADVVDRSVRCRRRRANGRVKSEWLLGMKPFQDFRFADSHVADEIHGMHGNVMVGGMMAAQRLHVSLGNITIDEQVVQLKCAQISDNKYNNKTNE